jgi:hypothetical protein
MIGGSVCPAGLSVGGEPDSCGRHLADLMPKPQKGRVFFAVYVDMQNISEGKKLS